MKKLIQKRIEDYSKIFMEFDSGKFMKLFYTKDGENFKIFNKEI